MARANISSVDRVSMPSNDGPSGRSFDPKGGGGTPAPSQQHEKPWTEPTETKDEKKKGPGSRSLSDKDKLDDDYLKRLEQQVQEAEDGKGKPWNIGGVPGNQEPGAWADPTGEGGTPMDIGDIAEEMAGGDTRIWVDPKQLADEVVKANRAGASAERIDDAEKAKRTDAEKSKGGAGGRGRIRDRVAIETLSTTDWAGIFRTKLTEYSREKTKYQPWNRRFVGNRSLRTKMGQKTATRDTLPELNLLIDTSSSLAYREMAVILGEIKKAIESAKIKQLNVFMWAGTPYEYKSWSDFDGSKFNILLDWVFKVWTEGGNDEEALYNEIIKMGKAKKFTISLTDAYLKDHFREGSSLKKSWTNALDVSQTIFAIIYPSKNINYEQWLELGKTMPGRKVPIFFDTSKFD